MMISSKIKINKIKKNKENNNYANYNFKLLMKKFIKKYIIVEFRLSFKNYTMQINFYSTFYKRKQIEKDKNTNSQNIHYKK